MTLQASPSTSFFSRLSQAKPSLCAPATLRFSAPAICAVTTTDSTTPSSSQSSRPKLHYFRKPKTDTSSSSPDEPAAPHVPCVRDIMSAEHFRSEMELAEELDKLLVVEFTKRSLPNTQKNHQVLLDLSKSTPSAVFLRVFADQSEECRDLLVQNNVKQLPTYAFFRNGRKVHDEAGMKPDRLKDQMLYYGQSQYPVHQLESAADLRELLKAHQGTGRLVVIQVTLTFCGPCVRVYPAVLQMSHKMAGSVVFGRLFGESDSSTKQLIKHLGIVEAPTFLFYRDEELLGRYVGSGKGELIGEVLRYQGVQCT